MNTILDTICLNVTAPNTNAGFVAMTAASGDSLQLRNAAMSFLMPSFHLVNAVGQAQIKASSMADPVNGIIISRSQVATFRGAPDVLVPISNRDTLSIGCTGSAAASHIETLVQPVFYKNPLGGLPAGNLIGKVEFNARATGRLYSAYATITSGTAGGYSGATLISNFTQNIRTGVNVALLGGNVSLAGVACITVRGPGTGNYRVAIPANSFDHDANFVDKWFLRCAEIYQDDMIPVLSTTDLIQTTVEVCGAYSSVAPVVTLYFAELSN